MNHQVVGPIQTRAWNNIPKGERIRVRQFGVILDCPFRRGIPCAGIGSTAKRGLRDNLAGIGGKDLGRQRIDSWIAG